MKKEILCGLLAGTTSLDATTTFVGVKSGMFYEANPLIAPFTDNYWILLVMIAIITGGYIIICGWISEKRKSKIKPHHYVGWAAVWHLVGVASWVI
jgi:ABC-type uncharacterized transport system permease subunit